MPLETSGSAVTTSFYGLMERTLSRFSRCLGHIEGRRLVALWKQQQPEDLQQSGTIDKAESGLVMNTRQDGGTVRGCGQAQICLDFSKLKMFGAIYGLLPARGPQQYNADLEPISYATSSGLENDQIHTIFEAVDGKLWFGHDNGVTAFDPIPAISTHAGIGTHRVRMIYEDSRGYLWFSVLGGVARYNPDTGETTTDSLGLNFRQDVSSPAQINATNGEQTRGISD